MKLIKLLIYLLIFGGLGVYGGIKIKGSEVPYCPNVSVNAESAKPQYIYQEKEVEKEVPVYYPQETYVEVPKQLTEKQREEIKVLANKPLDKWNEGDRANWKEATNDAPFVAQSNESQVCFPIN